MRPALSTPEILKLGPSQLVNKLWDKRIRGAVIRALLGGLTATELRAVTLTPAVRAALIDGLRHDSSSVRWWCLQLIDHVADALLLEQVVPLLNDPVPRVRKMAEHALSCEVCKQDPSIAAAGRALAAQTAS
jgi:hypothetical protein